MKSISQLFENQNSKFKKLLEHTAQTKSMDRIYKDALDASLSKHSHFAKIENETLIVTVDNALWAMRLLYEIPDILKNLRTQQEFSHIKHIRYLIATPKTTTSKINSPVKMSPKSEKMWNDLLRSLKPK